MTTPRFPSRNDDEPEDLPEPTYDPDPYEELPWDEGDADYLYDPNKGDV